MIRTFDDLREYIGHDMSANGLGSSNKAKRWLKYRIKLMFRYENAVVCHYLRVLRRYEYYLNRRQNFIIRLLRKYYVFRNLRLSYKYSVRIWPNCAEYGLRIPHISGGVIINALHIGKNCIVGSGVIIGNKLSQENRATIGDNVYISLGCKIIGKVNIGNNCIIAPNAVVVKDVPSGSVFGGIPAKFIGPVKCDV